MRTMRCTAPPTTASGAIRALTPSFFTSVAESLPDSDTGGAGARQRPLRRRRALLRGTRHAVRPQLGMHRAPSRPALRDVLLPTDRLLHSARALTIRRGSPGRAQALARVPPGRDVFCALDPGSALSRRHRPIRHRGTHRRSDATAPRCSDTLPTGMPAGEDRYCVSGAAHRTSKPGGRRSRAFPAELADDIVRLQPVPNRAELVSGCVSRPGARSRPAERTARDRRRSRPPPAAVRVSTRHLSRGSAMASPFSGGLPIPARCYGRTPCDSVETSSPHDAARGIHAVRGHGLRARDSRVRGTPPGPGRQPGSLWEMDGSLREAASSRTCAFRGMLARHGSLPAGCTASPSGACSSASRCSAASTDASKIALVHLCTNSASG